MKFTRLSIPDMILIDPLVHYDQRGFFFESYRREMFFKMEIPEDFVQDNQSLSARGALRGLHFQIPPYEQAKLLRVLSGSAYDVAVDIRPGSKTFGKFVSCILSGENKRMLYVPPGFAHGFCALENNTELFYKISSYYVPEYERGILWNDPAIGIDWPKLDVPYVLSEKDQKYPTLKEFFKSSKIK